MNILAHLTLVEASSVLAVFLAGIVLGAVVATSLVRRRESAGSSSRVDR